MFCVSGIIPLIAVAGKDPAAMLSCQCFVCLCLQVDILITAAAVIYYSDIVRRAIEPGDVQDLSVDAADESADYDIVTCGVDE